MIRPSNFIVILVKTPPIEIKQTKHRRTSDWLVGIVNELSDV